jgi:hypothetical protein
LWLCCIRFPVALSGTVSFNRPAATLARTNR